jgi:uncharacterized protein DUF3311
MAHDRATHPYGPPSDDPWRTDRPASQHSARTRRRRADASHWHWLLFVPIVVPLLVPFYNRIEPTLFGLPFYYWSQLSFAALSGLVVAIVHLATRGR